MLISEQPTTQEFLDFTVGNWRLQIKHGNLNSDPEYLTEQAIYRILQGFRNVDDILGYLKAFENTVDRFLFFDGYGERITDTLVVEAVRLYYGVKIQILPQIDGTKHYFIL